MYKSCGDNELFIVNRGTDMAGTYGAYKSEAGRPVDERMPFRKGLAKEAIKAILNDRYLVHSRKIQRVIDEHVAGYQGQLSQDAIIEANAVNYMLSQFIRLMPLTLELRALEPYFETEHLDQFLELVIKRMEADLLERVNCNLRLRSCWMRMHITSIEILKHFLSTFINKEGALYKEILDEGTIGLYPYAPRGIASVLSIPKSYSLITTNLNILFELCHKIVSSANSSKGRRQAAEALAKTSLFHIHCSWKAFVINQVGQDMICMGKTLEEKLRSMQGREPLLVSKEVYDAILMMFADVKVFAEYSAHNKCINNVRAWRAYSGDFKSVITRLCSESSTLISATLNEIRKKIIQRHLQLMYADLEDLVNRDVIVQLQSLPVPNISLGREYRVRREDAIKYIWSQDNVIIGDALKFLVVRQLYIDIVKAPAAQSKADNTEKVIVLLKWLETLPSISRIRDDVTEDETDLISLKMVKESYKVMVLGQIPVPHFCTTSVTISNSTSATAMMDTPGLLTVTERDLIRTEDTQVYVADGLQQSIRVTGRSANDNSIYVMLRSMAELSVQLNQLMEGVAQGKFTQNDVGAILSGSVSRLFAGNAQEGSRSNS